MNLTPRQREIAAMVAKGLSTPAIATKTGLSERTVEVHISQAAQRIEGESRPRHKLTLWFVRLEASEPA